MINAFLKVGLAVVGFSCRPTAVKLVFLGNLFLDIGPLVSQ